MPYKTRFREIPLPGTRKDLMAFADDANSLKSLGAATYRYMSPGIMEYGRRKMFDVFVALASKFESRTASTPDKIYPPSARKKLRYVMQGFQRAAREAGDEETEKLVAWALDKDKRERSFIDMWI